MMKEVTLKSYEESIVSAELDAIRDLLRENGDAVLEFCEKQRDRNPQQSFDEFTEKFWLVNAVFWDGGRQYGIGMAVNGFKLMTCITDCMVRTSDMDEVFWCVKGMDSLDSRRALADAVRVFGRELAKFVVMANEAKALKEELEIG